MITVCEQCDGTGLLKGGIRCGCREEDDEAEERRSRMGIVRPAASLHKCSDCMNEFKTPRALGVHKFHAHGMVGRRKPGSQIKRRDALLGRIFGDLTVIDWNRHLGKRRDAACLVRCKCGREKVIRNESLRAGNARTCGICIKQKPDANWRRIFNYYKTGAASRTRDYKFELSLSQVKLICQSPCAYCGREPSNTIRTRPGKPIAARYTGIDRIDSSGHYRPGNVVPCCGFCNRAKRNLPLEVFIEQLQRYGSKLQAQEIRALADSIGSLK